MNLLLTCFVKSKYVSKKILRRVFPSKHSILVTPNKKWMKVSPSLLHYTLIACNFVRTGKSIYLNTISSPLAKCRHELHCGSADVWEIAVAVIDCDVHEVE